MILYKRDYLVFGLFFVTLALYGIKVKASNDISTLGIKVQGLLDETKYYTSENARLREEILEAQSLTAIASKAAESGFKDTTNDQYIYLK